MDPWLFFAAISLCALGLVMVYSASAWVGHETHGSWEHFLYRQGAFATAGLFIMVAVSYLDYRVLRRFSLHLMAAAGVLLVAVLFTQEINGAQRWLRLGPINVQPSEIAKISLAIFLAAALARQGERVRTFRTGFLPIMFMAGTTMLLVLMERDLGTTILLGALTLIMLFVAGTRMAYVVAAVMIAAPVAWSQIMDVAYRRGRVEEFLAGEGYQVHQALIAVGSGGPFGLGLGDGRQKLGFLPENHTDFILATVGEELGLAGICLVLGLVALLVWRGLEAARHAPDRFGTYLAVGLSALFGLQAMVNMAVVLEVIPAKGITLPFLSYGGSSLLVSMGAVGLLLSISRRPAAWKVSDQRRARSRKKRRTPQAHDRPHNSRRPAAQPA
jgi:cell division protein FtsW